MEATKNYHSTYSQRTLRLYRPEAYPEFIKVCRDSGLTATKVLNRYIERSIKENRITQEELRC